jgi:hypothetical protein
MRWALFCLAFRQSLVPTLLLVGALLGVLAGVEYLVETRWGVTDLHPLFNALIGSFLVWSGFPLGSRLFSREFRERHFLLIHALPLSRLKSWLSLIGGALASGLISLALALSLRSSLVIVKTDLGGPINVDHPGVLLVSLFVGLYLAFFSAGACHGLFLGGTVLHSVGLVATLGLLGTLLAWLLHLHFLGAVMPAFELRPVPENGLGLLGILVVFYLFLSYRLYGRGEFPVSRVRWGSVLQVAVGHVVFLSIVWGLGAIRVRSAPFTVPQHGIVFDVSPDGRFVSIVEQRQGYPRFARVSIVDVATAQLQGQAEVEGLLLLEWSPNGATLAAAVAGFFPQLSTVEGSGALRERANAVVWLSTDGQQLERIPLGQPVVQLHRSADDVLAELVSDEGHALVDLGPGPGSSPTKLALAEDAGDWTLRELPEGAHVAVWNPGGRRAARVLRLGPSGEEMRVVGQPRSSLASEVRVRGSTAFGGDAIDQELDRRLPPVPVPGSRDVYRIVWDFLEEPTWTYALAARPTDEEADVFGLAPGSGAWQLVFEGLPWVPERDVLPAPTSPACAFFAPTHNAVCSDGIVVSSSSEGTSFTVTDLVSGNAREIPGRMWRFTRVSRRVGHAYVAAVEAEENPVILSPPGFAVYSVPSDSVGALWSEAGEGAIYPDRETQRLVLWTPSSQETRTLWPLR